MDELLDLGDVVRLFIFGSYEEGRSSKKLQVFLADLFFRQILINNHNDGK